MSFVNRRGVLHLNGEPVGIVTAQRVSSAWSFGEFEPFESFSKFAPLFGAWSLIMHDDDGRNSTSEAALQELRRVEREIDNLKIILRWEN
ncbi:MAG TPA: hypothetical protein VMD30_08115, partial [Tepidisphaeraceae bacterium]|nr:hypothetical protein [Tepidisphaeraceae bacterium]